MNHDFNLKKLADELTKYYGQIPQDCETTYLCSISVYQFRIDEDVLRIQDYDVIKLKDDWTMRTEASTWVHFSFGFFLVSSCCGNEFM